MRGNRHEPKPQRDCVHDFTVSFRRAVSARAPRHGCTLTFRNQPTNLAKKLLCALLPRVRLAGALSLLRGVVLRGYTHLPGHGRSVRSMSAEGDAQDLVDHVDDDAVVSTADASEAGSDKGEDFIAAPPKPKPSHRPQRAELHFNFAPIREHARFAASTLARSSTHAHNAAIDKECTALAPQTSSELAASPPRSFGALSNAEARRCRIEEERRVAARALKEERRNREAQHQERQQERNRSMQEAANKIRAEQAAAALVQKDLCAQRLRETLKQREMGVDLRRVRSDQKASWRALGQKVKALCEVTRLGAKSAREKLFEENLVEAKTEAKERSQNASQFAEAMAALANAKKASVKQRRDAESTVIKQALTSASCERASSAAIVRKQLETSTVFVRDKINAEIEAFGAVGRAPTSQTDEESLASEPIISRCKKRHERSTISRLSRQTKDSEAHARFSSTTSVVPIERLNALEARRVTELALESRQERARLQTLSRERREEATSQRQRMRDEVVTSIYRVQPDVLMERRQRGLAHDPTASTAKSVTRVAVAAQEGQDAEYDA